MNILEQLKTLTSKQRSTVIACFLGDRGRYGSDCGILRHRIRFRSERRHFLEKTSGNSVRRYTTCASV